MRGYLTITDDWFAANVFQVVVDADIVKEVLEIEDDQNLKTYTYPPWDPMGAVARY